MKPGDHPDFYRLPPPPGRSRESRIVLDERGRFWNGEVPVDHQGMAVAFASWIRHHPDDGRLILTNGYDWTYFTARDAPFFVRHVYPEGGRPVLRLFDGTDEPLAPESLSVAEDGALYARVKGGQFEARFLPGAQREMVEWIEEGEASAPAVRVGRELRPIPPRSSRVQA